MLILLKFQALKNPHMRSKLTGGVLQGSVDKTSALHNEIISHLLGVHKEDGG